MIPDVWGVLALLLGWLFGCACAEAQGGVVLFERAPLRPGLCGALRIQLIGSADVSCVPDGASAALNERIEHARGQLRAQGGGIGVLLERDTDPRLVRMYLVSAEGEQAALAIERVEDRSDPDVDRSLALKVRDAYEVIAFVDRELPKRAASAAAVLAPPVVAAPRPVAAAPPPSAPALREPFWLAFLELGGGISLVDETRVLGDALLGVGRASTRLRGELGAGVRLMSQQEERGSAGRISVDERGPRLAARLTVRWSRVELGGAVHLFLAFSRAHGTTADGTQGRAKLVTPVLGVGPDVRVRLFRMAYLRIAPSVELWTTSQSFAVDGQVLVDRGNFNISVPLSLLISLPVSKTSESFQP